MGNRIFFSTPLNCLGFYERLLSGVILVEEQVLKDTLILAKSGDPLMREELIRSHKEFIAKVSSKVCRRYLSWDNDDELSIALLGFNEAIDSFDPHGGASFHSFVQMVIRRRLVDYFRQEGKHQHLSLSPMNLEDDDEELSGYAADTSLAQYQKSRKGRCCSNEENQRDCDANLAKGYCHLHERGLSRNSHA